MKGLCKTLLFLVVLAAPHAALLLASAALFLMPMAVEKVPKKLDKPVYNLMNNCAASYSASPIDPLFVAAYNPV